MQDRSIRICFVAPNAYPLLSDDKSTQIVGGAELQQVLVGRMLAQRDYSVSMVCLDFGQPRTVEISGITVHRAYRKDSGIPVLRFFWPRLTSIWGSMKDADADVYYYTTAGMLAGVVAAFCRRHGKHSIYAAAANPDMEKNTRKIRFGRDRKIYEYGLRNVDVILVQNLEQAKLCRENFGRESILVPNFWDSSDPKTSPDNRTILWVSTIRQVKQPEIFIKVAKALPQYRFQIVGGPDANELDLYKSIELQAGKLDNLDFVGYVPFSEVGCFFDKAALFVNTSESEGFSNTFLQSWSRSISTVSFVDSGARLNGKTVGSVVASLDDMLATIVQLMEDRSERLRIGSECAEYVRQVHSPDRVLGLYESVFRNLMRNDL